MKRGLAPEAVDAFEEAAQLDPTFAQAFSNLGLALVTEGRLADAVVAFQRAVSLQPQMTIAHLQLGNALSHLGRFDEAEVALRRCVEIEPGFAPAWNNLGGVYRTQQKIDEALAAFHRAIEIDAHFAAAHSNLGNTLKDIGGIEEAVIVLRRAVELAPQSAEIHSNLIYALGFHSGYGAESILHAARQWAERHERPHAAKCLPHGNTWEPNRRLRIGYLSPDFREHVVGRNVLPILENHDRHAFEVHCFSTAVQPDESTPRFHRAVEFWYDCASLSDENLTAKIREQQIDILVDLTLHMAGNRLCVFARKPAPVQVTWAGYPGTTGLSSIDYRLTDPYLDPSTDGDRFYPETSIRLPHSFWCYRPVADAPGVNSLPAASVGYVTFGCLNNFGKASTAALDLWIRVMVAMPAARLILLCPAGSHRAGILNRFGAAGIHPTRLEFHGHTSPANYLRLYHRVDIGLDPIPYTGHSTTLDALWMGVPVVTLSGKTCVARGSVTALHNVGLPELVTPTLEQYIATAIGLATDIQRLQHLREGLRKRMRASPLCNEIQFTRDLETAFRKMWVEACYQHAANR